MQLKKNDVVPTSSQDEALARYNLTCREEVVKVIKKSEKVLMKNKISKSASSNF